MFPTLCMAAWAWPTSSASASASAPYARTEGTLLPFQFRETIEPAGGLDFSFEVDLWGRFRRNSEAARAEMLGTEYFARFVVMTLVSDLGAAYIRLRSLDEELDIARRTLAARRGSLDLVNLRERGGVAGLIDVRQSEILVAAAAQTVPDLERQIEQTESVISILLGRPPAAIPRGRPLGAQIVATAVPAGLPARLLEQRPDVRQAETQLAAATARIGVAKADYFPRPFLIGSMSAGGLVLNGQTFGPQGARAQQEVLTVAARETTQLANVRYRGGVSPYLEVLDSERQLFDAELGLVRLRRDELLAVIRLYKALGGGWLTAS